MGSPYISCWECQAWEWQHISHLHCKENIWAAIDRTEAQGGAATIGRLKENVSLTILLIDQSFKSFKKKVILVIYISLIVGSFKFFIERNHRQWDLVWHPLPATEATSLLCTCTPYSYSHPPPSAPSIRRSKVMRRRVRGHFSPLSTCLKLHVLLWSQRWEVLCHHCLYITATPMLKWRVTFLLSEHQTHASYLEIDGKTGIDACREDVCPLTHTGSDLSFPIHVVMSSVMTSSLLKRMNEKPKNAKNKAFCPLLFIVLHNVPHNEETIPLKFAYKWWSAGFYRNVLKPHVSGSSPSTSAESILSWRVFF